MRAIRSVCSWQSGRDSPTIDAARNPLVCNPSYCLCHDGGVWASLTGLSPPLQSTLTGVGGWCAGWAEPRRRSSAKVQSGGDEVKLASRNADHGSVSKRNGSVHRTFLFWISRLALQALIFWGSAGPLCLADLPVSCSGDDGLRLAATSDTSDGTTQSILFNRAPGARDASSGS